jgi:hypothetical protein
MVLKIDYRNKDRELINDCCNAALWRTVGFLGAVAENEDDYYSKKEVDRANQILNMIQEALQPVLVKPDEKDRQVKIVVG